MQSRRNILKTVPILAISCALPTRHLKAIEIENSIRHRSVELAAALHAAYGGTWRISIDGAGEFVLVSKTI